MTPNTETAIPSSPPTTAAGLDPWMSGGEHAEMAYSSDGATDAESAMSATLAGPAELGPVNAAEALALSLTQGTFSSPRKLVGPDGAELVVDPEQDAYYFESISLKPLAVLLQKPASAWTPVYSEAVKTARAAHSPQPLARLRWYAGLIATPGILGRALGRAGRYKLSSWPETEREFPKHLRIAKEMLHQPTTADEIVAGSGMSYEEVVDYINASFAGGRLEAASGEESPRQHERPSRRQRLIARLNKPLFVRNHS